MYIMTLQQISSAVYNSVVGGLTGITSNPKISIEQLEDEVVCRAQSSYERVFVKRSFNIRWIISCN